MSPNLRRICERPAGWSVIEFDVETDEIEERSFVEVSTTFRGPGVLDGIPESFTATEILEPVKPF